MPTIIEALRDYEGRPEEADALQAPPCDALIIGDGENDQRLNRQLAIVFTGLLEQPTVTHQIEYLHRTALRQEDHLADYRRKLARDEAEYGVTPAVWAQMVATLRRWATEIHEHALGGRQGEAA